MDFDFALLIPIVLFICIVMSIKIIVETRLRRGGSWIAMCGGIPRSR